MVCNACLSQSTVTSTNAAYHTKAGCNCEDYTIASTVYLRDGVFHFASHFAEHCLLSDTLAAICCLAAAI